MRHCSAASAAPKAWISLARRRVNKKDDAPDSDAPTDDAPASMPANLLPAK